MTVLKKVFAAIIVLAVVIIAAAGAFVLLQPSSGTSSGIVSIYVKDASTDWKYVNVTFSEVQIHQASGGNDSGWQTISMENSTIDLAALTNISQLLGSSSVPAGNYTQIRIVVISVTGMMNNGTNVTFNVPSGELKTTHPFEIVAGNTRSFTIDVDLQQSIVQNPNGWTFKPVLGAVIDG